VATRFQGDVERPLACLLSSLRKCIYLGMWPAKGLVPARSNDCPIGGEHDRPDQRIRLHSPAAAFCQRKGLPHAAFVVGGIREQDFGSSREPSSELCIFNKRTRQRQRSPRLAKKREPLSDEQRHTTTMTRWHVSSLERLMAADLVGRLAAKLHAASDTG
jgi:hypothetical protein